MPLFRFPKLMGVPPEDTPEGVVAIGGNLEPQNVLEAYRNGIFPWPISPPDPSSGPSEDPSEIEENGDETEENDEDAGSEYPLAWFSPHPRAILQFDQIHIPRSLKRAQNQGTYQFTINRAFEQVILACQKTPRPGQRGTWITAEMQEAYGLLHRLGIVHSVEAWQGEKLVGGIYGVNVDGAFAGESMFHHAPNASKLALLHLTDHLKSRGLDWMDIQMMTPHLLALGAHEISRDEYLLRLSQTRALGLKLF